MQPAKRTLGVGQHFGEVGVLLPQTPCIATCVASSQCSLLRITSSDFMELFGRDEKVMARMQIRLLRDRCVTTRHIHKGYIRHMRYTSRTRCTRCTRCTLHATCYMQATRHTRDIYTCSCTLKAVLDIPSARVLFIQYLEKEYAQVLCHVCSWCSGCHVCDFCG